MDKFYNQFAMSQITTDRCPTIPPVVYVKVWLKVENGKTSIPTPRQVIDNLLIAIKTTQFVKDASLLQPDFAQYAISYIIFPTLGITF